MLMVQCKERMSVTGCFMTLTEWKNTLFHNK